MSKNIRTRLFLTTGTYYGVCFLVVIVTALTSPEWMQFLPFGGLDVPDQEFKFADDRGLAEQLFVTQQPLRLFHDAMNLLSALAGTLVVMMPIRRVYMTDGGKKAWNEEVATSLLVLPLVVTAIVYVVKFSLPLAFALAGIFAGVRYRMALKRQSDAYFTFACIAIGLAAGTRSLGIGLLLATFFTFTIIAVSPQYDEDTSDFSP